MLYQVHLVWVGFELTTLVVISTDCIGSCKSNYHTITTMTSPSNLYVLTNSRFLFIKSCKSWNFLNSYKYNWKRKVSLYMNFSEKNMSCLPLMLPRHSINNQKGISNQNCLSNVMWLQLCNYFNANILSIFDKKLINLTTV
jgi:hypothetical protein